MKKNNWDLNTFFIDFIVFFICFIIVTFLGKKYLPTTYYENEQPKLRTAGQFKRDWVYVEDVVDAYIKLTDALISKNKNVSIAYNFSSKDYLSVMDIYSKVCKIVKGEYIEPIIEENSNFEIEDQYLSSNKISEELNIVAKFSIDEGLVKTIDWYKENISLMNGD